MAPPPTLAPAPATSPDSTLADKTPMAGSDAAPKGGGATVGLVLLALLAAGACGGGSWILMRGLNTCAGSDASSKHQLEDDVDDMGAGEDESVPYEKSTRRSKRKPGGRISDMELEMVNGTNTSVEREADPDSRTSGFASRSLADGVANGLVGLEDGEEGMIGARRSPKRPESAHAPALQMDSF